MARSSPAKIIEDILTAYLKQPDFKDLFELTDASKCSKLIVGYQENIQKKLKPGINASGKPFFYSATSDIIPSNTSTNYKARDDKKKRDKLCLEIGYENIRAFQIFAALALNVVNTGDVQRGGALTPAEKAAYTRETKDKPVAALRKYFDPDLFNTTQKDVRLVSKTNGDRVEKYEIFVEGNIAKNEFKFIIATRGGKKEDAKEGILELKQESESKIVMNIEVQGLSFNRAFVKQGYYASEYEDEVNIPGDFAKKLLEFARNVLPTASTSSSSTASTSSAVSSAPSSTSGEGYKVFGDIKKIFQERANGTGDMPITYAIGRLKTLFNNNQTYICETNLPFDTKAYLPKDGKPVASNLYIGSWLNLYFDNFQVSADNKVVFTQSEAAKVDMRYASELFANLNGVNEPDFLLKRSFKGETLCQEQQYKGRILNVKQPALRDLSIITTEIAKVQQEYTQKVIAFLSKMFRIVQENTPAGVKTRLVVNNNKGIPGINLFGMEARNMLLEYYLRVEALFKKGSRLLYNKRSEYLST